MNLDVLTIVLAGGEGKRLRPLTEHRNKPAVPFAGRYRLVDIPLSNAVNSGLDMIYVLTQGKDYSFTRHLQNTWALDRIQGFVVPFSPQSVGGFYKGDADAVRHMIPFIQSSDPEFVLIVPGDNVVKMDYSLFVQQLANTKNADFAISVVEMPVERAGDLGTAELDKSSFITKFLEKDPNPPFRASDNKHVFASMGTYLFRTELLLEVLEQSSGVLFGSQIIPEVMRQEKTFGYNFTEHNAVPGVIIDLDSGKEVLVDKSLDSGYWEDVGKLPDFFRVHMEDILGDSLRFVPYTPSDIHNPEILRRTWPFYTHERLIGPGHVSGNLKNVLISEGVHISESEVETSVLSPGVTIENSSVTNSIIFDGAYIKNSNLDNVIIDKHSKVIDLVLPDTQIPEGIYQHESGIVVVPRAYGR